MIIRIGFVAVLTANIASYFVENDKNKESEDQDKKDENQLIDIRKIRRIIKESG